MPISCIISFPLFLPGTISLASHRMWEQITSSHSVWLSVWIWDQPQPLTLQKIFEPGGGGGGPWPKSRISTCKVCNRYLTHSIYMQWSPVNSNAWLSADSFHCAVVFWALHIKTQKDYFGRVGLSKWKRSTTFTSGYFSPFPFPVPVESTSYPSRTFYYTFISVVLYFFPILVMSVAYSLIVWRLWSSQMPGERVESEVRAQNKIKKRVSRVHSHFRFLTSARRKLMLWLDERLFWFWFLGRELWPIWLELPCLCCCLFVHYKWA